MLEYNPNYKNNKRIEIMYSTKMIRSDHLRNPLKTDEVIEFSDVLEKNQPIKIILNKEEMETQYEKEKESRKLNEIILNEIPNNDNLNIELSLKKDKIL